MNESFGQFKARMLLFFVKFILIASSLVGALFPVWTYSLLKRFLVPEVFWQNIFFVIFIFWSLGILQIIFLTLWFIFALWLCLSD